MDETRSMTKDEEIASMQRTLEEIADTLCLVKQIQEKYKDKLLAQQEAGVFDEDFHRQGGFYSAMLIASTLFENALFIEDKEGE